MSSILFAVLFALPIVALASSVDTLKQFVRGTQSARAQFNQSVLDKNRVTVQEASGTMQFSRPGKFRWDYVKPYQQQLVGDGSKLWIYDAELEQVTVRKLDQALGSSPAALLAGNNEIEKNFVLKDVGTSNGLNWLEATPKGKETNFEMVRMGFNAKDLKVMELRDYFGQTTVIRFSQMEKNPRLSTELFKFTPPKGADVIGE